MIVSTSAAAQTVKNRASAGLRRAGSASGSAGGSAWSTATTKHVASSARATASARHCSTLRSPGAQDAGRQVKLLAGRLALRLEYGRVDEILDAGLHRWLTGFLDESAGLGEAIRSAYLEAN